MLDGSGPPKASAIDKALKEGNVKAESGRYSGSAKLYKTFPAVSATYWRPSIA